MWLLQSQMTCVVAWKSGSAQLAHFTVSHNICQPQGGFYINMMWVIYFFTQTFRGGGGWVRWGLVRRRRRARSFGNWNQQSTAGIWWHAKEYHSLISSVNCPYIHLKASIIQKDGKTKREQLYRHAAAARAAPQCKAFTTEPVEPESICCH